MSSPDPESNSLCEKTRCTDYYKNSILYTIRHETCGKTTAWCCLRENCSRLFGNIKEALTEIWENCTALSFVSLYSLWILWKLLSSLLHAMYMFLHNFLNLLVQIANKMGLQKKWAANYWLLADLPMAITQPWQKTLVPLVLLLLYIYIYIYIYIYTHNYIHCHGAPKIQDRKFQTTTFQQEIISCRKSHKDARYQDILTNWLTASRKVTLTWTSTVITWLLPSNSLSSAMSQYNTLSIRQIVSLLSGQSTANI
jgi:hypothetical protein